MKRLITLCSGLLLLAALSSAQAGQNFVLQVESTNITGSCDSSTYLISFTWETTVVDQDGSDLGAMTATDEDGRAMAADWSGTDPGNVFTRTTPLGNGDWINSIVPNKDITVNFYDIGSPFPPGGRNTQPIYDDIEGRADPVGLSLTFNPGNCDSSLLVIVEGDIAEVPRVPTLSQWSQLLMILALAVAGWVAMRRYSA